MTETRSSCTICATNEAHHDPGGRWLYSAVFVGLVAVSVFMASWITEDGGLLNLALGIGYAIWTVHFGLSWVYEWTLHDDGHLETRALFRRRFEIVTELQHDQDEDFNRWYVRGTRRRGRIHLSATSGYALANALRARDASELIDDPGRLPPAPWWVRIVGVFSD